jgi:pentatricopeptide repeat protein
VNGFQINADPVLFVYVPRSNTIVSLFTCQFSFQMVYACMLECAVARGNWDRALGTLSELSRDGLTISAIPTEWLLKTVSICIDKVRRSTWEPDLIFFFFFFFFFFLNEFR